MLSGHRAVALFVFAGLFVATQAGQADARSSAAVAADQDASILSSAVDAAKLRAHTAARSSSRKMLTSSFSEADMEKLINEIFKSIEANPGKPLNVKAIARAAEVPLVDGPYRRSLMGLQDAS